MSNKRAIVLYLLMHQPYRVNPYSVFDIGTQHDYFNGAQWEDKRNNEFIFRKVAEKSYYPTLRAFQQIISKYPEFKISLSLSGTVIDQLLAWEPELLQKFQNP